MNKHRRLRKSKKIQGRGFFSDILKDNSSPLQDKAKAFVTDKLNEILSKKKKNGAGLKFL